MATTFSFGSSAGSSGLGNSGQSSNNGSITATVDDGTISVGDEVTFAGFADSTLGAAGLTSGGTGFYLGTGTFGGATGYVFGASASGSTTFFVTFDSDDPPPNAFLDVQSYTVSVQDGMPDQTLGTDPACFAAGTPIATPDGEVAVEDLRIGDRLLTAHGAVVLVKWVGRQTVSKLFTPAERFRPVRIAAGALAENVPNTDLVVTADHGLLFDGVVVNAGALVNGTTIVRVPAEELSDHVTYWHVETEDHHVILAAGAPAETFVDNVTRRHFDNYAEYVALYGEPGTSDSTTAASGMVELPHPRVMSRRQLPRWIADRIEARAAAMSAAVPEAV